MRERGCEGIRWTSLPVLCLLAALAPTVLTGCVIVQGDGSGLGGDELSPLPDPAGGYIKPFPQRSPAQEKKWQEGQQKAAKWYHDLGYVVLKVTQGSRSGDVIDWIDETSVVGSDAPPPPPMPAQALALPEGVGWERMELEDPAEARGPAGSIPFVRPLFLEYVYQETGATTLDDWLKNYQMAGDPSGGEQHLYAGLGSDMANRGAAVSINSFGGSTMDRRIEPFTQSLREVVVGCRAGGEMWQWVGIASSRRMMYSCDKSKVGPCDDEITMKLRAEFLTAGTTAFGDNIGGWNDVHTGFVPARGIPYPLGASFDDRTLSTVGGPQYESLYQVELKEDGNWWVGHNGNWLGYYPSTLFGEGTLTKQACVAQWYGEVNAWLANLPKGNTWTWTNMSSGHFAEDGFSNAGYFRNPVYLAPDGSGAWYFPPVDPNVTKDVQPNNPACYTKTPTETGASPWDVFFYADGPGSDNPSCK